ncbi:MAG: methyltransferase domain-containing protein [Thermoleophilia bacterium]|nr:methyltransferase domain-containing protein [Thermoleophilia bacterium]
MSYYKYYFSTKEIEGSAERIAAKNRLIYSLLERHLPAEAPVLELGVGKGFFARLCDEHGHPYQGLEADHEQCRMLEQDGIEVTCASVPPVTMPAPEGGFGLIYSAHLLEHLKGSHEVHRLLADCAGLLADDGVAAMLFPDAMAMGKHFWNCDYTHAFPTTERRVAQAMADAGLEVMAAHRLCGHYTGGKRLLARLGSHPLVLGAAQAIAGKAERRDLFYRGWMYLQQDILLVARLPRAD